MISMNTVTRRIPKLRSSCCPTNSVVLVDPGGSKGNLETSMSTFEGSVSEKYGDKSLSTGCGCRIREEVSIM